MKSKNPNSEKYEQKWREYRVLSSLDEAAGEPMPPDSAGVPARSYDEPHHYYCFPIEDGRFAKEALIYRGMKEGPIFPYFLHADFSRYEAFRDFADDFGLDGFAWHSEKLSKVLDNRLAAADARYLFQPISTRYLRNIWREIKDELVEEQQILDKFYKWQQLLQGGGVTREQAPILETVPRTVSRGVPFDYKPFEQYGLKHAADVLNNQVSTELVNRLNVALIGERAEEAVEMSALFSGASFIWKWKYASIIARCYAEIAWLINDGKGVKMCRYCGEAFVPKRPNEKYCDRMFLDEQAEVQLKKLAEEEPPELTEEAKQLMAGEFFGAIAGREEWWEENASMFDDESFISNLCTVALALNALDNRRRRAIQFYDAHKCKKLGPQKTETYRLTVEQIELKKKRKKLLNKMEYLEKTGRKDSDEYKRIKKEHKQLKKISRSNTNE